MPQSFEALSETGDNHGEDASDLTGPGVFAPSDAVTSALESSTRLTDEHSMFEADAVDTDTLTHGPGTADIEEAARNQDGGQNRATESKTTYKLGCMVVPEVAGEEAGEDDRGSEAVEVGPERVTAAIAESDVLIARIAAAEATRLEKLLGDPNLTDLGARQALHKAIDRLRTTGTFHEAATPMHLDVMPPSRLLGTPIMPETDGDPELTTTRPFISVSEHELRLPETTLEREAEYRHALLVEARTTGDPIRRAAMDKAPENIRKRTTIEWKTRDPEMPGYLYKLAATFDKEEKRPTLIGVSCAFMPDVPHGTNAVDGINTMHPSYIPLTVTAGFDGADLTDIALHWRHAKLDRSGVERFGPVWQELATEGRGQLLSSLVKVVDNPRTSATQGQLSLVFGRQPQIVGRAVWEMGVNNSGSKFQRLLAGATYGGTRAEMQFTYNAKQHAYLRSEAGGKTNTIVAEDVFGLMRDIARFFPIMPVV